jgi:hypothetical protein
LNALPMKFAGIGLLDAPMDVRMIGNDCNA